MSSHQWKYVDPDSDKPGRKGMLLSNQIQKFTANNLLIADGFESKNLRPAAYTLRIGGPFVDSTGTPGVLDEKKTPHFYMEPNSIVYVSAFEKLDLPCYIAARFNLRVNWVYKGVLLGTGPQVEPGYLGYLSCPLYNLTDRRIRIDYLMDFATIDFERTTDFCAGASSEEITKGIKHGDKTDKIEWAGQSYLVFKQKEYKPLTLLPDHDVISSLRELAQEVKTWRHIGIAFAISFFALTLTLLSFGANAYKQVNDLTNRVNELSANLGKDQKEAQRTVEEMNALKERVTALDNQIRAEHEKKSATPSK